jgi:SET domain-containing protein
LKQNISQIKQDSLTIVRRTRIVIVDKSTLPVFHNIDNLGDFHIALYAQRDIESNEELFFDYDLSNDIDQIKYPWIVNSKTIPQS